MNPLRAGSTVTDSRPSAQVALGGLGWLTLIMTHRLLPPRTTVAALACLATLVMAGEARATSDGCAREPAAFFPPPHIDQIPANTRVWINGQVCASAGLIDESGAEVALVSDTVISASFDATRVLTPAAPLEKGAFYEVTCSGPTGHVFQIDVDVDLEPPAIPSLTDRGGGDEFVEFEASQPFEVLVADVDDTAALTLDDLSGEVSAIFYDAQFLTLGKGGCRTNHSFEDNSSPSVRFAALDWAGNFSGWSDPIDVEVSGCAVGGGRAGRPFGIVLAFAAVLGVVIRRRIRPRSESRKPQA